LLCIVEALQGGRAWWVAPTHKTARVGWRLIQRLAKQIPGTEIKLAERIIYFPGGGEIAVHSAVKPDTLLGEGLNRLVMEETPDIKEKTWTRILRPMLSDRNGDATFIFSPRGKEWTHRLWLRGQDPSFPDWQSWQFPTSDNPFIDPQEIEDAKRDLPENVFRQEYLAEFVDDGGVVFRNVRACVGDRPNSSHNVVIGCDWAQITDFTVFVAIDIPSGAVVGIERFNQIDWYIQRGRLEAMSKKHTLQRKPFILAELNSIGAPNVEELQRSGLRVDGFTTTNQTKAQIIQALVLAFERGSIIIPDNPQLIAELEAFEAKRLPSGRWSYSAPDGMHDDMVIALALAWWARQGATTQFQQPSVTQPSRFDDVVEGLPKRGSRWEM
jgi:hypothetical protein